MTDGRVAASTASAHIDDEPHAARPLPSGAESPIRSDTLFEGRNTLTIEHEGCHYVLRATRSGKLILTK